MSSYLGWTDREPLTRAQSSSIKEKPVFGGPVTNSYENYVKNIFHPMNRLSKVLATSRMPLKHRWTIGVSSGRFSASRWSRAKRVQHAEDGTLPWPLRHRRLLGLVRRQSHVPQNPAGVVVRRTWPQEQWGERERDQELPLYLKNSFSTRIIGSSPSTTRSSPANTLLFRMEQSEDRTVTRYGSWST